MNPTIEQTEGEKRSLLPLVLGLAIVLTLVMTCVSVGIYYMNGYNKFDLSRPGYEAERLNVTSDDSQKTYDTTSPVNAAALDSFLSEYDANVNAMRAYSDFQDTSVLSDGTLFLEPSSNQ
jgi:hypothetical protein